MKWLWRISLFCGITPLLVGTLVFVAWWATRADGLMLAGAFVIQAGLVAFVAGAISLGLYIVKARAAKVEAWGRRSALAGGILLANFPAAIACVAAAIYMLSVFTVRVENLGDKTVDRLSIIDPTQARYEFGPVAAHEIREATFHFAGEGSVAYELVLDEKHQSGVLFGYISSGLGDQATLRINSDGVATGDDSN